MNTSKEGTPRELWRKICTKRRQAWESGQQVRVESILKRLPELKSDPQVVAEIAFQEYCLLCDDGQKPDPQEFLKRFPESAEALQRLFVQHANNSGGTSGFRDTVDVQIRDTTFPGLDGRKAASVDVELETGEMFGRYLLVDRLGEGAMGVVYLARDTALNRPVALKFPRFSEGDVEKGVRVRFYREAQAAAVIDHPNICPIHDIGDVDGQDFIAMGYVAGATLDETVHQLGPLDAAEACRIIRDVAQALHECHQHGVIHRDLKPANIVMNQRGTPIIMDFGLAAVENSDRVTTDNQLLGTIRYMSPEQISGSRDDVGPHSDIYSLGATLYELLTATPPFTSLHFMEVYQSIRTDDPAPPSTHVAGLDSRVDPICLRALAKQPRQRYQSMTEFAEALTAFLSASAAG